MVKVQMVKIPVSDVAQSAAFYRDTLGLNEDFVVADYGWAQLSADNLPIALYELGKGGGTGKPGTFDSLHLTCEDLTPLIDKLKNAGVDTAQMPFKGDDGSLSVDVTDPDGNRIKVMQQQA